MTEAPAMPRGKTSIWLQAARPFSFTASMTPVFIGAGLALHHDGPVRWELFPLVIVCSLLYHAATNMVSDYYDFKKGVDRPDTFGSSRTLVDGLLEPRQVLVAGLVLFGIGSALGLIFVAIRGLPILVIGMVGFVGGYSYCGLPIGYKYIALGDLLVFVLMGVLMVIGSFLVLTGTYAHSVLIASIPISCLVAAILHANNTRDIAHDVAAGIKTTASVLGHKLARWEYVALVAGAYVSVAAMVAARVVTPWVALVVLSLPPAIGNVRAIMRSRPDEPDAIAMMDVRTAQHHLLFGLLFTVGLVVGRFAP